MGVDLLPEPREVLMLKWVLLIAIIAIAAVWIRKGKLQNKYADPDHKEIDQNRYYVKPPHEEDRTPDDHQNDRY